MRIVRGHNNKIATAISIYHGDCGGPRPSLVVESRSAQELSHVLCEALHDRQLCNGGEQEQSGQEKTTDASKPGEEGRAG